MQLIDLQTLSYSEAWKIQDDLREKRLAGQIPDTLIFVEHPPVFTLGKQDCESDFCSSREAVQKDNIEIIKTNRGGRITYHGPGQLVCYFIFDLESLKVGVKDFVHKIEDICIKSLSEFGIASATDSEHPGIWIGRSKIVAIGLNVTHGVTQHGFAMNVNCDLKPYRHIIACGIRDRGVTTMALQTGKNIDMNEIKTRLVAQIESAFKTTVLRSTYNAKL